MKSSVRLVAALVALGTVHTVSANAQTRYASKSEFIQALAGKSIMTTTKSGKPYKAVYNANGSGTFSLDGASPAKFTWTFKEEVMCSSFRTIKFTECNKITIVSPTEVQFIDAKSGQMNNSYSVQ